MTLYPHLSQPITINKVELANRIVRAPHGTGFVDIDGLITDKLINYHLDRARGGVGLTILETSVVDPSLRRGNLNAWSDKQIERWARLADLCHAEGMKVFQQIFHPGPRAVVGSNPYESGRTIAATTAPRPHNPFVPLGLTVDQIDYHVEAFAAGAARVKAAGLDGVEIHGAHGYLLADFLSPLTNTRTDEYGGDLDNRMRFLVRVLREVRDRVGPDFAVGVRLSGSEWTEGGLTAIDAGEIAARLEKAKLIDYVSMTTSSYFRPWKIFGAMHEPLGYEIADSMQVSRRVSVPTLVTGRILTLQQAEEILARGDAQLVSMVRATIADPHLVKKSLAGKEAEVRPCISCNQSCVGGLFRVGSIACTVNVRVGNEATPPPPPAAKGKSVAVIGAGPAGMEAALTAAKRGHKVEVYEASDRVGGAICYSRMAPHHSDIGRIIDHQATELRRLGVPVHLDARITEATLGTLAADAFIIATGGEARRDGWQRFNPRTLAATDAKHVRGVADVMANGAGNARKVLIFDDFGLYPAVGVAETLLAEGREVTFVTCETALGSMMIFMETQAPAMGRLARFPNFKILTQRFIRAIQHGEVELQLLDGDFTETVEADLVVLCTATTPRRELYDSLSRNGREAILAGDAVGHSDLTWAIASGTRAGEAV